MSDSAIIIFAKNPQLGKVKTRLAVDIGDEKALSIYNALLEHTRDITLPLDSDKIVFYSDYIDNNDIWPNESYQKKLQSEGDLGQRLKIAAQHTINAGYKKIIFIGTDCVELMAETINNAIAELEDSHVTIGPANDGGYYLIGFQSIDSLLGILFDNKPWSTKDLLSETIISLERENYKISLLDQLSDIDDIDDLKASKLDSYAC